MSVLVLSRHASVPRHSVPSSSTLLSLKFICPLPLNSHSTCIVLFAPLLCCVLDLLPSPFPSLSPSGPPAASQEVRNCPPNTMGATVYSVARAAPTLAWQMTFSRVFLQRLTRLTLTMLPVKIILAQGPWGSLVIKLHWKEKLIWQPH